MRETVVGCAAVSDHNLGNRMKVTPKNHVPLTWEGWTKMARAVARRRETIRPARFTEYLRAKSIYDCLSELRMLYGQQAIGPEIRHPYGFGRRDCG